MWSSPATRPALVMAAGLGFISEVSAFAPSVSVLPLRTSAGRMSGSTRPFMVLQPKDRESGLPKQSSLLDSVNMPGAGLRRELSELNYKSGLVEEAEVTAEAMPAPEIATAMKDENPVEFVKRAFAEYAPKMSEKEALLWLFAVVAFSGMNFPLVKYVGEVFDNPTILAGRFVIATALLSPWLGSVKKEMAVSGLETGAWLAAGYMAQAYCLTSGTSSGVASFFASLSCVVCPFFEAMTGKRLGPRAWIAALLAVSGAGVLELGNGAMPTTGDLTGLLQPLLFGIYLIRTEAAMEKFPKDAMEITVLQCVVVAMVAAVWGVAGSTGGAAPDMSVIISQAEALMNTISSHPGESVGMLWMGAFPSAFALALETVIVSKLSSSVTALMFSTEPLFAAVFGGMFLGEQFGPTTGIGGALAIAACVTRTADPAAVAEGMESVKTKIKDRLQPEGN